MGPKHQLFNTFLNYSKRYVFVFSSTTLFPKYYQARNFTHYER